MDPTERTVLSFILPMTTVLYCLLRLSKRSFWHKMEARFQYQKDPNKESLGREQVELQKLGEDIPLKVRREQERRYVAGPIIYYI